MNGIRSHVVIGYAGENEGDIIGDLAVEVNNGRNNAEVESAARNVHRQGLSKGASNADVTFSPTTKLTRMHD